VPFLGRGVPNRRPSGSERNEIHLDTLAYNRNRERGRRANQPYRGSPDERAHRSGWGWGRRRG
jgi:hypothetical protein